MRFSDREREGGQGFGDRDHDEGVKAARPAKQGEGSEASEVASGGVPRGGAKKETFL